MRGINKVIIVGTLGQDPELKQTSNGTAVCQLSLATNEKWKDKSGEQQEKTEWHRVVLWQRLAEIAGEYLHKGSQVYIEGKLQTRKWQDKEGNDRWSTEIIASELQLLGGKGGDRPQSSQPAPQSQPQGGFQEDPDIPFQAHEAGRIA